MEAARGFSPLLLGSLCRGRRSLGPPGRSGDLILHTVLHDLLVLPIFEAESLLGPAAVGRDRRDRLATGAEGVADQAAGVAEVGVASRDAFLLSVDRQVNQVMAGAGDGVLAVGQGAF